jgi:hypothetical protein
MINTKNKPFKSTVSKKDNIIGYAYFDTWMEDEVMNMEGDLIEELTIRKIPLSTYMD